MLRIYIAHDCPGSPIAVRLAEALCLYNPTLPLEVVDVGTSGVAVPAFVFGTPTYTWNERIIFLGNPSKAELFERVSRLCSDNATW